MRPFLLFSLLLAPLFGATFGATSAAANTSAPVVVEDAALTEISGLIASRRYPGHVWAHNDSGDSARIFLISPTGQTVATVQLKGVFARDWEDMAFADGWIYIGDIGDNFSIFPSVRVHRLREPQLDVTKVAQKVSVPATHVETMELRYHDGPRDAETLVVLPSHRVLIVSKESKTLESGFYAAETEFQEKAEVTLRRIASHRFGGDASLDNWKRTQTTGGDLSSDGSKIVVSTYSQLHEIPLKRSFDARSMDFSAVETRDLPALKRCESIAYSADGAHIYVSSEGERPPLHRLPSTLIAQQWAF